MINRATRALRSNFHDRFHRLHYIIALTAADVVDVSVRRLITERVDEEREAPLPLVVNSCPRLAAACLSPVLVRL